MIKLLCVNGVKYVYLLVAVIILLNINFNAIIQLYKNNFG